MTRSLSFPWSYPLLLLIVPTLSIEGQPPKSWCGADWEGELNLPLSQQPGHEFTSSKCSQPRPLATVLVAEGDSVLQRLPQNNVGWAGHL